MSTICQFARCSLRKIPARITANTLRKLNNELTTDASSVKRDKVKKRVPRPKDNPARIINGQLTGIRCKPTEPKAGMEVKRKTKKEYRNPKSHGFGIAYLLVSLPIIVTNAYEKAANQAKKIKDITILYL